VAAPGTLLVVTCLTELASGSQDPRGPSPSFHRLAAPPLVIDPKNPTVPVAKNNPCVRQLPVGVQWNPIPFTQIALFAPVRVDDAVATIVRCHASEAAPTFAIELAVAAAQVALLGAIDLAVAAQSRLEAHLDLVAAVLRLLGRRVCRA